MSERLFTPRFVTMCAYSFTVFTSIFQLLPAAPYRILELGGTTATAGLFLGFLTYASAASAPVTGHLGDRVGQRRVLIAMSLVLAGITASYAVIRVPAVMLGVVVVHGLFWSALLSASGAYVTAAIPEERRAEGLGYWGLASVVAIAVAPPLGFWVYGHGWGALCAELVGLNLLMAAIAWRLPDDRRLDSRAGDSASPAGRGVHGVVEWRVVILSIAMALVSFGYGGLTTFSALLADRLHVAPRSLFLTLMAAAILVGRLTLGRHLDRVGHRRVLVPALGVSAAGIILVALAGGPLIFLAAAVVFGGGFGVMYPAFAAYVMRHAPEGRRGAAFGAMIAAFDAGIGTGSSVVGWIVERRGFATAFGVAALFAVLAAPYFIMAERRLGFVSAASLAKVAPRPLGG